MSVLIPIGLAVVVGVFTYVTSASQTKRTLAAQSSPLRNPALEAHFARLANALDLKRLHVNVYEIDPINGLAAPDGQIYITRGFLKKFLSGEVTAAEISSVIAHELGHVALGTYQTADDRFFRTKCCAHGACSHSQSLYSLYWPLDRQFSREHDRCRYVA